MVIFDLNLFLFTHSCICMGIYCIDVKGSGLITNIIIYIYSDNILG